jgi:hypothetical protein
MQAGLMFVAFGKSHDAFEAQMRRMAGLDDGILDACSDLQAGDRRVLLVPADARRPARPAPARARPLT